MTQSVAQPTASTGGPRSARLEAFCSPNAFEIFQSIVFQQQIWKTDPFDVDSIHSEAREVFGRLLRRASSTPAPASGRVLLLHGEAGSGKTHLLRAFRGATHQHGAGYFTYLQMTTESGNYSRYLLSNVIASLDQPYYPPEVETSALVRLSTGLLDAVPGISFEERETLRNGWTTDALNCVQHYADRLMTDARFADCDLNLMRALLHLQRNDPRIKSKVLMWLRCEDLSLQDRTALGDLVPRNQEEHPLQMVAQLGKMMHAVQGAPFVVCLDQLEDVFNQDMAPDRFRKLVDVVVTLTDAVPTLVAVVACLEDYYTANRQYLLRSKLDRLERDPEPLRLTSHRGADEIAALVARRLEFLYEDAGLVGQEDSSVYPFRPEHFEPLKNLSTRNVLDLCRTHHQKCIAAGNWVEPAFNGIAAPAPAAPVKDERLLREKLEQTWNDARAANHSIVPDDEVGLAQLLAWGLDRCNAELPASAALTLSQDGRLVFAQARGGDARGAAAGSERFVIAVCERAGQGGGLSREVAEVEQQANGLPVVLVRSTRFPRDPKSMVSVQIGKLIGTRGRRVEVENTDWRTLLAFKAFCADHEGEPSFASWQQESRPLTQLPSLQKVLGLDRLPLPRVEAGKAGTAAAAPSNGSATPAQRATAPAAPATRPAAPVTRKTGPMALGVTRSLAAPAPVQIDPLELKQHMAFLGGPGSGKTTSALTLIEQLLLRGVPVILLDRKGDLCRYADPEAWQAPADPALASRLAELRDRVDVALFTPGAAEGRPLAIPIIPDGMRELPSAEQEQVALNVASGLAGMMSYKTRGSVPIPQAILGKAIEVLIAASNLPVTLDGLQALVQDEDPSLINAVGGYEPKHYKKLAQDLLTLKLTQTRVLNPGAEPLNIDALLGRSAPASAGKTRLCIISTQFLGMPAAVDFWVAQFLFALDRWRAKSGSETLQAVVMLDEADQYLPAMRQPATKAPLESLLRRARSAGLGFMIATQSPGDLDYKCRDNIRAWLVGRVKESTAIKKLKPMFSEARIDAAVKLPVQSTGEFYLIREREVLPIKTDKSLIDTRQLPEQQILELARAGRDKEPRTK